MSKNFTVLGINAGHDAGAAIVKNGKIFKAIAINEVSLLRQSRQTASLRVLNGKKILIKKLICEFY